MLNWKSVLITGGTGTFGKAFITTILAKYPNLERVVVFSRDEFKQFEMQNEPRFHNPKLRFFIGDVRDRKRLYRAFEGIDVVIHAAALKQIPSCEYNPFEAVKTNINGAQNVIDAAIDRNVHKIVALSTDKASSPINLYGATKLCSDKLFIAGNAYTGNRDTKFCVVRYGNVAGSRGSVIPYFQKHVAENAEYLPITDKRMTRFWLKIEDAVDLVLSALETMHGGELYVRKLPSMKITDLAQAIAPKLKIKTIGIRPGEKIHEQMISREEAPYTLEYKDYYLVRPQFNWYQHSHKHGKPVPEDFVYDSGTNTDWLTVPQIKKLIKQLDSNAQ